MDVLFFLKERTRLIRQYDVHAANPFNEVIRKIEAREEPYVPPCSEDGEPPFLSEWIVQRRWDRRWLSRLSGLVRGH